MIVDVADDTHSTKWLAFGVSVLAACGEPTVPLWESMGR